MVGCLWVPRSQPNQGLAPRRFLRKDLGRGDVQVWALKKTRSCRLFHVLLCDSVCVVCFVYVVLLSLCCLCHCFACVVVFLFVSLFFVRPFHAVGERSMDLHASQGQSARTTKAFTWV